MRSLRKGKRCSEYLLAEVRFERGGLQLSAGEKDIPAIFTHRECGSETGVSGAPILGIVNFLLFLEEKVYDAGCLGRSWRSSGIIPSCEVLALLSSSPSPGP